jgi:hypothetical protein
MARLFIRRDFAMSYTKRLWRLTADAVRLATFRDVPAERVAFGWGAISGIVLATVALPVGVAFYAIGREGEWTWRTLPYVLMHVPLILGAAVGAAYAIRRPGDVQRLFAAGLLASLAVDAAWFASHVVVPWWPVAASILWGLMPLFAAWLALAMAVYACRSIGRGGRRALVIGCCIVLVGVPLGFILRDRSFWHPPYHPESAAAGMGLEIGPVTESAFYRQPEVLARELDSVRPRTPGRVNVYLIALAGYGREDVFMREVESVTELFRERFDAEGHVVRLVNNPVTILDTPIASRTSLQAALGRVAHAMNRDEDVLVLFMTSHGSQDQRFALQLGNMQFNELEPATVRGLLDDAGIRNRVVIVSTCFSGGYVAPLAGPDTLVITAAAADRTSFGCGNEFAWTYFGDAYFNHALRTTHSFTRAFDAARPAIEARERAARFAPSEPQISVGDRIATRLASLAAELDAEDVKVAATRSPATAAAHAAVRRADSSARARHSPQPS